MNEYKTPEFKEDMFSNGKVGGYFFVRGLGNGYYYSTAFNFGYGNGNYHYINNFNEIQYDFNRINRL